MRQNESEMCQKLFHGGHENFKKLTDFSEGNKNSWNNKETRKKHEKKYHLIEYEERKEKLKRKNYFN